MCFFLQSIRNIHTFILLPVQWAISAVFNIWIKFSQENITAVISHISLNLLITASATLSECLQTKSYCAYYYDKLYLGSEKPEDIAVVMLPFQGQSRRLIKFVICMVLQFFVALSKFWNWISGSRTIRDYISVSNTDIEHCVCLWFPCSIHNHNCHYCRLAISDIMFNRLFFYVAPQKRWKVAGGLPETCKLKNTFTLCACQFVDYYQFQNIEKGEKNSLKSKIFNNEDPPFFWFLAISQRVWQV